MTSENLIVSNGFADGESNENIAEFDLAGVRIFLVTVVTNFPGLACFLEMAVVFGVFIDAVRSNKMKGYI